MKEFQQVRVIPRINGTFEIEIVYLTKDKKLNRNKGVASIDFGVDNLVTMITDFGNPIIYSGKQVKSKNQYFNKKLAKLKSFAETNNKKKTTKKIRELYSKREQELNDLYHKVSRNIVNYLKNILRTRKQRNQRKFWVGKRYSGVILSYELKLTRMPIFIFEIFR